MRLRPPVLLCGLWLAGVSAAGAQTLTVNGSAAAVGKTAADFATTAIGDPWDFENPEDYSYMWSIEARADARVSTFASVPSLSDGLLHGTLRGDPGTAAIVQMQFEGTDDGVNRAYNHVSRTGVAYPIDANRYRRLAFRVRRDVVPGNEWIGATWFMQTVRAANSIGSINGLSRRREVSAVPVVNQSPTGVAGQSARYHIYAIDLDGPHNQQPWAGVVRGLELRIATQMPGEPSYANTGIDLDWVRLTERGTAVANLQWSGMGGAVTLIAQCAQTGDQVQLTPDAGGLGPGATFPASGSYAWDYGYLPSGTWTITARSGGRQASATLTINAAPLINITEPDAAGGRDWATTMLADAWDLTNVEDVTRSGQLHQIVTGVFGERGLEGVTRGGNAGDMPDPLVMLTQNWGKPPGTYPVIDANTYHRLSFELQTDHPELIAPEVLSEDWGGVARVMWEQDGRVTPRVSQDLIMVDGIPNRFVLDLAAMNSSLEVENPGGSSVWAGGVGALWFRVNEANRARGFRLANVRLAADDEPNGNGFFTIKWIATDATFSRQVPNGGAADATVTLSYYPASNPGDRRPVQGGVVAASTGQFSWDVAGIAPGPYVVVGEITDSAGNTQTRAATGPVSIGTLAPNLRTDSNGNGLPDWWEGRYLATNPAGDDDKDGVTNVSEYRAGTNPLTSNVWNLSEGATGVFSERLALANPDAAPAEVTVTYLRENGGGPVARSYSLLPYGRLTVNVNEIAGLRQDAVSAVVTANSGGVVVERSMFWGDLWYGGHTGKAMQNPQRQWFLAEGAANERFSTYILLANASGATAHVRLEFLRQGLPEGTPPVVHDVNVEPFKRFTVSMTDHVPAVVGAFSTRITSDMPITVERSMYFHGPRVMEGGTEAAAVPGAERNWYLAEGATGFFSEYVLLANPGSVPATVKVRYLTANGEIAGRDRRVPPNSRDTIDMNGELPPGHSVSVALSSDQPIVVERAMYWPSSGWIEAHASAGITETGTLLALAEGEVGGSRGFESYVLIANPSTQAASVRVTLLREAGRQPVSLPPISIAAGQRSTIAFGDFIAAGLLQSGEKAGILIRSENDVPIVAERAVYWNGGGVFWGGGSGETAFKLK